YVIALLAGHKSPDTTWGSYIKRGPDLRQRYGEPFPPLSELVSKTNRAKHRAKLKKRCESADDSAERAGFEPIQDVDFTTNSDAPGLTESTRDDVSARIAVDIGPALGPSGLQDTHTAVAPLEEALMLAAKAGRWDVVVQLAKELEARRLARALAPLKVLKSTPKPAPVFDLANRRRS
ncbi:MAG: hypothetical protein FWD69_20155, partial [Polyangiaceae bacterium]|nr:hypothetical protein [Polyangiaceae bacterium]